MAILSPSILNADFLNLGDSIKMLNSSETDWIHLDVMDGVFVPNISFGIPVVQAVKKITQRPLDVHLMIVHPEKYIKAFKKAGADTINVHYEACPGNLRAVINQIRDEGCKVAVTIKPDTPVENIYDYAADVDMILVMSVFPGFGGQEFIEDTYGRVEKLKNYIGDHQLNTLIEVDGGVTLDNARQLCESGVDALVVGSFIFKSENPLETIKELKQRTAFHSSNAWAW